MKKGFLLFTILSVASFCFAQQSVKFFALSHVEKAAADEPFKVTFVIEGTDFDDFNIPELTDFDIVGAPMQSSNISIVNGEMSKSFKYTYYLQAKAEGTFIIEGATIIVDGETMECDPLEIKVGKHAVLKENLEEGPSFRKDKKKKKKKPATIRV